jgi:hypothetical protein
VLGSVGYSGQEWGHLTVLCSSLGVLRYSMTNSSGVCGFTFCNGMSTGVAPGASNARSSTRGIAIGSHISGCGSSCDVRLSG